VAAIVGELAVEVDRVAVRVHVGVEEPKVIIRGCTGAVEEVDALQEACHACRGLQMSEIRLGAGVQDGQLPILHDHSQSTDFNGITQGSASAMTLRNRDLASTEAGLHHRRPDALLLRWAVWSCHAGTSTILVDGRTDEAGQGVLSLSITAQCLQDKASTALASCIAVR